MENQKQNTTVGNSTVSVNEQAQSAVSSSADSTTVSTPSKETKKNNEGTLHELLAQATTRVSTSLKSAKTVIDQMEETRKQLFKRKEDIKQMLKPKSRNQKALGQTSNLAPQERDFLKAELSKIENHLLGLGIHIDSLRGKIKHHSKLNIRKNKLQKKAIRLNSFAYLKKNPSVLQNNANNLLESIYEEKLKIDEFAQILQIKSQKEREKGMVDFLKKYYPKEFSTRAFVRYPVLRDNHLHFFTESRNKYASAGKNFRATGIRFSTRKRNIG